MSYTLGEAARATGKSKTTIQRAIQKGTISATRNSDGSYTIDPVELHRVFPVTPGYSPETVASQQNATDDVTRAVLEERVRTLEQQVRDLVDQRDSWQQQAERLTMLLTTSQPASVTGSPSSATPSPVHFDQPLPIEYPEKPRSWWQKLIGL